MSRQILSGIAIALIILGIVTLGLNYFLIQSDLERQVQRRAEFITHSLQLSSEGLIEIGYTTMLERLAINYATLPDVEEVAIVAPDGRTVTHNLVTQINQPYGTIHPELSPLLDQVSETGQDTTQRMVLNQKPVLVDILPFSSSMFGTQSRRGVAIAIIDLTQMQREGTRTFLTSTLTLAIGIIGILGFIAILIHRLILNPLYRLNQAIKESQRTGNFHAPEGIPNNEIQFLSHTLNAVFKQLATYEELEKEIVQRKQVEAALRISESKERGKSKQLENTLKELKKTQIHLIQTEKMSSLGQMVAGIAHELNNPVNFISNNIPPTDSYFKDLFRLIYLYQEIYPNPHPQIQELVEEIELDFLYEDFQKILTSIKVGSERIENIVSSLRNFSRLDEASLKVVDLYEDIESTLLIIKNRLRIKPKDGQDYTEIQVIKQYSRLPLIECYPRQLNQVFMNLFVNAIDALQNTENPQIEITTQQVDEQNITISIKDNGEGVAENAKEHLFDPFFTTKPVGSGTGLGLSISYEIIVNKHQGQINYSSQRGEGTEFIITIPISQH